MPDSPESSQFIRLEGFFNQQSLNNIEKLVGQIGTEATLFEVEQFRDRDEHGRLLEDVPKLGKMVTRQAIHDFSKRVPGMGMGAVLNTRASTLFDSLWGHVWRFHGSENPCQCSLRGGIHRVEYSFTRADRYNYVDPLSLVTAFKEGELGKLPIHSSDFRTGRGKKSIEESVCYPILPRYIDAITR